MAKKTQGTALYFIDPSAPLVVQTMGCVTAISGITAARDQIETTCLSSAARTYEAGLAAPGTAQFTINFDPSDASHILVHEMYVAGTTLEWTVGWSDGTAAPTASGGVASIAVTTPGTLYATAPAVTFSGGGGGTGAAATAAVSAGGVISVTVTNAGSGYTAAPTVIFTGGGGSGAVAAATLGSGVFVLPTTRSWTSFDGFPSDVPFDFGLNSVVTSSVSVQMSGFPALTKKV